MKFSGMLRRLSSPTAQYILPCCCHEISWTVPYTKNSFKQGSEELTMKLNLVRACRTLLIAVAILLCQFHSSEAHRGEVSFSIKLTSNVTLLAPKWSWHKKRSSMSWQKWGLGSNGGGMGIMLSDQESIVQLINRAFSCAYRIVSTWIKSTIPISTAATNSETTNHPVLQLYP